MNPRQLLLLLVLSFAAPALYAQDWSLAGNSNAASTSKLGTTNLIPLNLVTNNATRVRIQTNGNVGIGTTNPQQRLHLDGSGTQGIFVSTSSLGTTSGAGISAYVKGTPTASGQRLGYYLLGSRGGAENNYQQAGMLGYAGGAWTAGSSHPAYLSFETTNSGSITRTERMRINPNGNVGIGTTSPSQKLHVVGNAYIVGNHLLTGNMGIGTTTPSQKLHVVGNAAVTGNLGVGTTAPTQQLHVVGNGLFTSGVHVSSGTVSSTSNYGPAIYGSSTYGYGVRSTSSSSYAVYASSGYIGVYGDGTSYGLYGNSSNIGVNGNSTNIGVSGNGATYGVNGYSGGGFGVYGNSVEGSGVYGSSTNRKGGYFVSVNEIALWARTGRADRNWAGVFEGNVYTYNAYQTSDKNLKKNIESLGGAMSIISRLKPKSYEFRRDGKLANMNLPQGRQYGMLAQDLEEVLPNLVMEVENEVSLLEIGQPSGTPSDLDDKAVATSTPFFKEGEKITLKAVNYTGLIPVTIAAIQEQQVQLNSLQEQNNALQEELKELRKMLLALTNGTSPFGNASSSYLEQNTPNPARGETIIRYRLPEGTTSARVTLTNSKGQLIKTVNLTGRGTGQLNLNTQVLAAGAYTYTLYIDGRPMESKQLLIAR